MLAALAASSCCLGPLILAALGLGGVGTVVSVARYRPLFLVVTAAFLGVGFYLTYRTPKSTGDACGCDQPKAGRLPRLMLWVAAFFTVLTAASPSLLAKLSKDQRTVAQGRVETAVLRVEGIDCEACAAPMRKALSTAGGFDRLTLDVKSQKVTVFYEPAANRPAVYLKAIEGLGYEPSLVEVKK